MDKDEILKIVREELDSRGKAEQYGVASVPAHTHNGIDSLTLPVLYLNQSYLTVAKTTTGVTAVNVFSTFGSFFNSTITAVFLIAQDTTAGNITLKNAGATVVAIAKGTVSGTVVGGVTLANVTVKKGSAVTVVSDSTGNATVVVVFKVTG